MTKKQEPAPTKRAASRPAPPSKPPKPLQQPVTIPAATPARPSPSEVVRRRRPGFKLVNGGWRRDPSTARRREE